MPQPRRGGKRWADAGLSAKTEPGGLVAIEAVRRVQLGLALSAACLAPLPFGSVDQFWTIVWVAVLSLSIVGHPIAKLNSIQFAAMVVFLATCGLYALVAFLQVIPGLVGNSSNGIWQTASKLLQVEPTTRFSARAEIPLAAVGHYILLVAAFLSGFVTGTSRKDAQLLFKVLQSSILVYAVYGLLAQALAPGLILWAPKSAYMGDLTATFVNHNTAATFLGAGVIMWACTVQQLLKSFGQMSLRLLLLGPSNEEFGIRIVARAGACIVCLFALISTGSRAGLACAAVGLLAAILLGLPRRSKARLSHAILLGTGGGILVLYWLSESQSISTRGLFDEGRWTAYSYSIGVIRQHPWLGTGAGTFVDVFPHYRGAELSSWGVWDFAHSTILEIAFEMGVPIALMVIFAAVAATFLVVLGAMRSTGQGRAFLCATSGIMVMSFLHSTVDFSLQIPGYLIPFGILAGCGLARAAGELEPSDIRHTSQSDASREAWAGR
jgi:O-antigen ligase